MTFRADRKCGRNPQRNGQRSLGAGEGVLVALRRYSLDEAFGEIVDTAKRRNVAPIELAEALVAIAENRGSCDVTPEAMAAARGAWAALFDRHVHDTKCTEYRCARPTEPIPGADEADLLEQQLRIAGGDDHGRGRAGDLTADLN